MYRYIKASQGARYTIGGVDYGIEFDGDAIDFQILGMYKIAPDDNASYYSATYEKGIAYIKEPKNHDVKEYTVDVDFDISKSEDQGYVKEYQKEVIDFIGEILNDLNKKVEPQIIRY